MNYGSLVFAVVYSLASILLLLDWKHWRKETESTLNRTQNVLFGRLYVLLIVSVVIMTFVMATLCGCMLSVSNLYFVALVMMIQATLYAVLFTPRIKVMNEEHGKQTDMWQAFRTSLLMFVLPGVVLLVTIWFLTKMTTYDLCDLRKVLEHAKHGQTENHRSE